MNNACGTNRAIVVNTTTELVPLAGPQPASSTMLEQRSIH